MNPCKYRPPYPRVMTVRNIMAEHVMTVEFIGFKRLSFFVKLGSVFIRLGCWVIGCDCKIKNENIG